MTKRVFQGHLAWLNDVEVSKTAYFALFPLMVLNIILIRQPFFEINVPQVENFYITLHEIGIFSVLEAGVLVLGGVAILLLLIPIMKSFEWKYKWFMPSLALAIVECISILYLYGWKNELVEETLIGYVYQLLSIEVRFTASAWALFVFNVLVILFSVKVMIDIRNNYIKYQLPLMT